LNRSDYKRILLRGVNWLGDAVMLTPAVCALRGRFPDAHISILCKRAFADVYRHSPHINEIIEYDSDRGVQNILALAGRIRRGDYDLAIVFPRSYRALLPVALGGVPERIGYAAKGRRLFLTKSLPRSNDVLTIHRVRYYAKLLEPLGIEEIPESTEIHIDEESKKWAGEFLQTHRTCPGRKLVGMLCGATYGPAKQWFPERFAELARRLTEDGAAEILIVGGPAEVELAGRVEREAGVPLVNSAGKTTVLQLAALIKRCDLFISNDTGPMHVADAVGVPIAAIFGPTDPVTTSPYGKSHRIITVNADCSPCLLRACPTDHRCMTGIAVDDVEKIAREFLSTGKFAEEAGVK